MLTNSMNMELPYYQKYNNDDNNNNDENVHVLHGVLHGDSTMLVYVQQHHESKVLKILAQAMVLALLIMVLPEVVGANYRANNNNNNNDNNNNNNYVELITRGSEELLLNNNPNSISLILNDLANEGLVTSKDETLIVSHSQKQPIGYVGSLIVLPSDSERQRSVSDDTFDFAFSDCYAMVRVFIDRTLKLGGVVMVRLGWDPNSAFQVPSNYKIVYFRRIGESTYIAMRKTANAETTTAPAPASASAPAPPATAPVTTYYSSVRRRLLEFLSEEKKAVLGNLEDVLLEPPRSTTGRSKTYLRKTKFLPDLLNDSLDGYSRRVYIDVGGRGQGSTRWFKQNYPTRNKDFDMYRIETVPEAEVESDDAWEGPPTQMGISDWLWRNVKAEEYVVMKADAEVVEEMLKSKAIVLVDELFLECKPFGKGGSSKRAYWECLALYGRLRDFGVAVHQWWG